MKLISRLKSYRLLSRLKNLIVPPGRKPRKILAEPFKGIGMNLNLRCQTQTYLGLFEREVHPWLRRFSKGVLTALDIGAAEGEYTLYFLSKTQAAKVYAFEPDTGSKGVLHENLRLNCLSQSTRLNIVTTFVGDSDSDHEIRLDSLGEPVRAPCIIKMDVEGAEERVLKGASRLNGLPGVRWLIETHAKELEDACVETLTAAGFRTRIIPNAWWRVILPELRPTAHNRWLAAWKGSVLE